MAEAPAFQLYVGDFLSDPLVDIMTPEQLGGYFRLLLIAWKQDDRGYLPFDEELLAQWSRLGARWKACRVRILACWRVDQSRIFQKRMVEVASELAEFKRKQSEAGRRGNDLRWASGRDRVATDDESGRDRVATVSRSPKHRSSSSSSTSEIKDLPPANQPDQKPTTNPSDLPARSEGVVAGGGRGWVDKLWRAHVPGLVDTRVLELAAHFEDAAQVAGLPREEVGNRLMVLYGAFRDGYPTAKRPPLTPDGMMRHMPTLLEMLTGRRPPPPTRVVDTEDWR